MSQTIFLNIDVYKSIHESLFFDQVSHISSSKDCRNEWFSSPPKCTTVRVNTLLTSVKKVSAFIKEFIDKEALKRGLPTPAINQHPDLQDCLIIQPWHTDNVQQPRHELEVIVDAACGVSVLRGAHVFAPGVMGILPGIEEGNKVSVYADSAGRCTRGLSVPFLDSGKVFVGNGLLKMSRKFLFQKDLHPKGIAVEMTHPASSVVSVCIPQQLGLLQNLPSIVCGHVMSPQVGDNVIDLCAAPGHKTTHLAALMDNKGVVIALDKIARKIEALKTLCKSMGMDCVKAFLYDSKTVVSSTSGCNWTPPFVPNTFDKVLLDAPCSALGQRPQIGSKLSNKQIASYPKLQKKLFISAVKLVRPGGTLVYSTCSLTLEENENIVSWALDTFPQLNLVPALPIIGKPGNPQSLLPVIECQKVQRFGPPLGPRPEDDTIGFFIAKFIKAS